MKNYAGHRLAPWLSHVMVSRQETARQLLTPGEVMQLPSEDEIILVSGVPPIRATKIKYYADKNFKNRVSPAPVLNGPNHPYGDCPPPRRDDWGNITAQTDMNLYNRFKAELIGNGDSTAGGKERKVQSKNKSKPKSEPEVSNGGVDFGDQDEPTTALAVARNIDAMDRATPGHNYMGGAQ
jgi:type IV secretion system protein VirD4